MGSGYLPTLNVLIMAVQLLLAQLTLCPDAPAVLKTPRTSLMTQLEALATHLRAHPRSEPDEDSHRRYALGVLSQISAVIMHHSVDGRPTWVDQTPEVQVNFHLQCVFFADAECIERQELMMCGRVSRLFAPVFHVWTFFFQLVVQGDPILQPGFA
jgi:hypothetical protein